MTTRLTDEQIAELRRLEREATPGPWELNETEFLSLEPNIMYLGRGWDLSADQAAAERAAMALVIAARNALPSMLDEIAAARSRGDERETMSGDLCAVAEAFARTAEAAVAAHEAKGNGGMRVPFHGDFANAVPSILGRLRWWAREFRTALASAPAPSVAAPLARSAQGAAPAMEGPCKGCGRPFWRHFDVLGGLLGCPAPARGDAAPTTPEPWVGAVHDRLNVQGAEESSGCASVRTPLGWRCANPDHYRPAPTPVEDAPLILAPEECAECGHRAPVEDAPAAPAPEDAVDWSHRCPECSAPVCSHVVLMARRAREAGVGAALAVMPDQADVRRTLERLLTPAGTCPPGCRGFRIEPVDPAAWSGCRCRGADCDCPQHVRLTDAPSSPSDERARAVVEAAREVATRWGAECVAPGITVVRVEARAHAALAAAVIALDSSPGTERKP